MIRRALFVVGISIISPAFAGGGDPNLCDLPAERPDLIIGELNGLVRLATEGDVSAYSAMNTSCNVGTCWADWFATTEEHPVFIMNAYRLEHGRFEQIGMSFAFHRYFALSSAACSTSCLPTNGAHLGVNCSSTNSASVVGATFRLGPRFEINAATGEFPFPFTEGSNTTTLDRRLQIAHADLDPALHQAAQFFLEGQNLAADESAVGNPMNNASHREFVVSGPTFDLSFVGTVEATLPAIFAWKKADPSVIVTPVDVPADGRIFVAARAVPTVDGLWSYEYAVHNLNSHRAVRELSIPLPDTGNVGNEGFHDIDYHSGEPIDGTDWSDTIDTAPGARALRFATATFAEDPDANALRFGTLYNFRFVSDLPPASGTVELGLFRPGSSPTVSASSIVPAGCIPDGSCDAGETSCSCPADCGPPAVAETQCGNGLDDDCDGAPDCSDSDCCPGPSCASADLDSDSVSSCTDCTDADGSVWALPGEVSQVVVDRDLGGAARLSWAPPVVSGGISVSYEVLRYAGTTGPGAGASCLSDADPTDLEQVDSSAGDDLASYLVRAHNDCPGQASLGTGSQGPRIGECDFD